MGKACKSGEGKMRRGREKLGGARKRRKKGWMHRYGNANSNAKVRSEACLMRLAIRIKAC